MASFYHHFDIVKEGDTPPPPLTVRVCDSISCSLNGAEGLIEQLQQALGDKVRVQRVPCVGRCETAPAAVIGTRPLGNATADQTAAIVASDEYTDGAPAQARDYAAYRSTGGYRQLQALVADPDRSGVDGIIQVLDDAGLRGLGGAGFPAGRKWRIVRGYPGPRLMAVNIDEGEPGTFKDRY